MTNDLEQLVDAHERTLAACTGALIALHRNGHVPPHMVVLVEDLLAKQREAQAMVQAALAMKKATHGTIKAVA